MDKWHASRTLLLFLYEIILSRGYRGDAHVSHVWDKMIDPAKGRNGKCFGTCSKRPKGLEAVVV